MITNELENEARNEIIFTLKNHPAYRTVGLDVEAHHLEIKLFSDEVHWYISIRGITKHPQLSSDSLRKLIFSRFAILRHQEKFTVRIAYVVCDIITEKQKHEIAFQEKVRSYSPIGDPDIVEIDALSIDEASGEIEPKSLKNEAEFQQFLQDYKKIVPVDEAVMQVRIEAETSQATLIDLKLRAERLQRSLIDLRESGAKLNKLVCDEMLFAFPIVQEFQRIYDGLLDQQQTIDERISSINKRLVEIETEVKHNPVADLNPVSPPVTITRTFEGQVGRHPGGYEAKAKIEEKLNSLAKELGDSENLREDFESELARCKDGITIWQNRGLSSDLKSEFRFLNQRITYLEERVAALKKVYQSNITVLGGTSPVPWPHFLPLNSTMNIDEAALTALVEYNTRVKTTEIGGIGIGRRSADNSKLDLLMMVMPPLSSATSGYNAFDPQYLAVMSLAISDLEDPQIKIITWWHTHPNLGIFLSGTDNGNLSHIQHQNARICALVIDTFAYKDHTNQRRNNYETKAPRFRTSFHSSIQDAIGCFRLPNSAHPENRMNWTVAKIASNEDVSKMEKIHQSLERVGKIKQIHFEFFYKSSLGGKIH